MPPNSAIEVPRYDYIDSLRGFAILGVLATHCVHYSGAFPASNFAYEGGYGVQLFFMISAFTIFLTLNSALSRKIEAVVRNFYIRRFFRIVPMFWVGLLIYHFAQSCREHYATHFDISISHYFLTAILQHGWHPFYINSVVPGGWSIAVESTFYLIAPFLVFRVKNWQGALSFLLGTMFTSRLATRLLEFLVARHYIFQHIDAETVGFFSARWFIGQLPVFACGILAFQIVKAIPKSFQTKTNGLLFAASFLILFYVSMKSSFTPFMSRQAFLSLSFALWIIGLSIYPIPIFVNSVTCFLGRISYSFYLLHFLMLKFAAYALHPILEKVAAPLFTFVLLFASALALTAAASYLTYRFVEQPFIGLSRKLILRPNGVKADIDIRARVPAVRD